MTTFLVGQRVRVVGGPKLLGWDGRMGVVVDIPASQLNAFDVAVEFDDDNRIGCLDDDELEAIS